MAASTSLKINQTTRIVIKFNNNKGMQIDDNKNANNFNLSHINNIKSIKEDKHFHLDTNEKSVADAEFIKNIQKALQNAINENEEVINQFFDIIFISKFKIFNCFNKFISIVFII